MPVETTTFSHGPIRSLTLARARLSDRIFTRVRRKALAVAATGRFPVVVSRGGVRPKVIQEAISARILNRQFRDKCPFLSPFKPVEACKPGI